MSYFIAYLCMADIWNKNIGNNFYRDSKCNRLYYFLFIGVKVETSECREQLYVNANM